MSREKETASDIFAFIDHASIAQEVLNRDIFLDDPEAMLHDIMFAESKIAYAGETIMQRLADTIGAQKGEEHRSTFFIGSVLALLVLDEIAGQRLGDISGYRQLWLSKPSIFIQDDFGDEGEFDTLSATADAAFCNVEHEYEEAIDGIGKILVQDQAENELLYGGFAQTLTAGKICIAEKVLEAIDQEACVSDEMITEFLDEYDLTGTLQEIDRAFLGHCEVVGADPYDLSDADARRILGFVAKDFEKSSVALNRLEAVGPVPIVEIDTSTFNTGELYLVSQGQKFVGSIKSVTLGVAPIDPIYLKKYEPNSKAWRFMPSFILQDIQLIDASGSYTSYEGEYLLGAAVPLAQYRTIE